MSNSKIFSDIDSIALENSLNNLFKRISTIDGRQSLFERAEIDDYFINGRDFNLPKNEFIGILVADFKSYNVSRRNPTHPLIKLTEYILKRPQQEYNLEDRDIELFEKILVIGQQKIEFFIKSLSDNNNQYFFSVKISGTPKSSQASTIDFLIITALKDELDVLKMCDNDSGNSWEEHQDSLGYSYFKKTFKHINGSNLEIAVSSTVDMGEENVNELSSRLIRELKPSCLAMTGVCAGNKEDVFLGDVIVADKVFKFDHGKLIAYYQEIEGKRFRSENIFHDITTHNLDSLWKSKIQNFSQKWIETIQTIRPKSYAHQERWLLHKLYDYQENSQTNQTPQEHQDRATECPDWKNVIERLRRNGLLEEESFELTNKGIKEVKEERLLYLDDERYRDPSIPQMHIGTIGTTSYVQKDPEIFKRLKEVERKALGVEMESAAIGFISEKYKIPMIVVKSVQDYADYDKNDQFRFYAAETSARFLLAFLTTTSGILDE